jgi:hypothetical protein
MASVPYRAMKLVPYILRGELNVKHGGVDVGMAHEAHEGRKRDACPNHVSAESVAEAVRVCFQNRAYTTVMTKDGAKTGWCEGRAPVWTLKDKEKERGARFGPFDAKVAVNHRGGLRVNGQESLPVSFSLNEHLALRQTKVLEP